MQLKLLLRVYLKFCWYCFVSVKMTEYWKSQARKYCEFCKCWFADNKVSISFHENGKRHKESVQKHISQLTKKSAKDAKQQGKIDDEMKKMEAAAMAAYLKDVQNNADLTSQAINDMLGQTGSASSNSNKNESISTAVKTAQAKAPPAWQEVKSDDGSSYYWNVDTNATTWEAPDRYLSVAEQEKQKLKQAEEGKAKEKIKKQKKKEAYKEAKAFVAREQMKERAVKPEPAPSSDVSFGPAPRVDKPYGSWTAVVTEPVEKIDLQLPKVTKEVIPPPVVMEEERFKFGEKRVESLGEGPVEFKRRKVNTARRNMRQKLDDD